MKKIIYLLLITSCFSCTKIILGSALKKIGAYEEECNITYLSNGDKKVAFLNMHHIGRKEFYDHVGFKVDSLQKEDYIIFYEGVGNKVKIDSLKQDVYDRKFRKLLGFIPDSYIDTTNNRFLGKYKLSNKYQLINQPDYHAIRVDTSLAVKADISMNKLIDAFEKKYNDIKLDNCDFNTDLKDKTYNCNTVQKSLKQKFNDEFILEYRNRYVATKINNHKNKKIAIIYGKFHLPGMYDELKKIDPN